MVRGQAQERDLVRPAEERDEEQRETVRLVRLSRTGDQDAFRQLVERKRDKVFRVAWQHLGNADDARSVAQAVFVRVWQNLDRYDEARPFDTWLYQVTANAAIDHHRRRKARPPEAPLDDALHAAAAVSDPVETAELRRLLHALVGELSEKMRLAFLMREVEGLSTAEVAEALGTTESTVRNHVFTARKLLREAIETRFPELRRAMGSRDEGRA
jgi:RNA polymerase sigma-70 factor (ECF subfamily)